MIDGKRACPPPLVCLLSLPWFGVWHEGVVLTCVWPKPSQPAAEEFLGKMWGGLAIGQA